MRRLLCLLMGAVMLAGCASHKPKHPPADAKARPDKLIVSREAMTSGKVVRVNDVARFVVLNYPVGTLPTFDSRLGVYRKGLKVGELKVTDQRMNDNAVADIVSGEVQVGDETRAN